MGLILTKGVGQGCFIVFPVITSTTVSMKKTCLITSVIAGFIGSTVSTQKLQDRLAKTLVRRTAWNPGRGVIRLSEEVGARFSPESFRFIGQMGHPSD